MNRPDVKARRIAERKARLPRLIYPDLPICARNDDIVAAIRQHPVVIVCGETGSGKTTQIPKMCLEAGRGLVGVIGCTQPRRIAAVTVAARIAQECGEELGQSVAYKIRFDERGRRDPFIKVMTDGVLLAETQSDRRLSAYDTLIIDEAHERSLNIDFVLGYLKTLLARRPDLKVVITSATLEKEKFSRAFGNAPIIDVSGRLYPVEVRWAPLDPKAEESGETSVVDAAVAEADAIVAARADGDILIFMPTEQDIREACDRLAGRWGDVLDVLPLYSRLPAREQMKVFAPGQRQRIVVATNVAETSVTVPNIRFVIDSGLARIATYNARSAATSLPVRPIARSSADQRKGRCGRVRHGICIRLYSEEDYAGRPLHTPPEIQRSNLAGVVLRMMDLRLGSLDSFPFVDRPPKKNVADALDTLRELDAIDAEPAGHDGLPGWRLTPLGKVMAKLPLDPRVARMMLESRRRGCLPEVAVIAAGLSVVDPRERPADQAAAAKAKHDAFREPNSDFLSLLKLWNAYADAEKRLGSSSRLRRFCREHFLSFKRMREWQDVHGQILHALEEHPEAAEKIAPRPEKAEDRYAAIHKAILAGHLALVAEKKEKSLYTGARGREMTLFPGSVLAGEPPRWLLAAEAVETSRLFARTAAKIESPWIEEMGKHLCRSSYSDAHWERSREDVVAFERVSLFGLTLVARRPVSYGRIDAAEANRIFIRDGLVPGEVKTSFGFLTHNLAFQKRLQTLADKTRRWDVFDEEDFARFYAARLPGVVNVAALKRLVHGQGGDAFLRMREADFTVDAPDAATLAAFPDAVTVAGMTLPLAYRFAPGKDEDGVTLNVPLALLPAVASPITDWAVPGLLRDKVTALLRGLPGSLRRRLPPAQEAAERFLARPRRENRALAAELGAFLRETYGVDVPGAAWPQDELPSHLQMRYAVVAEGGQPVAVSRDIGRLQETLVTQRQGEAFAAAQKARERENLSGWPGDEIPETLALDGGRGVAFPALAAEESGVALRLFRTLAEAREAHPRGVCRLAEMALAAELRHLKKNLTLTGTMKLQAAVFGGPGTLEKQLYEKVVQDTLALPLRNRAAFDDAVASARKQILPRGRDLLALAAPAVEAAYGTWTLLKKLEDGAKGSKAALAFVRECLAARERLVPADFLRHWPEARLGALPRYLKALAIRAERGLAHLDKDAEKAAKVRPYAEKLAALAGERLSPEKAALVDELREMVEEFRVSLFAQELKTPYPVSPKRLDEKLREIDRAL